jgi:hypothetical protein
VTRGKGNATRKRQRKIPTHRALLSTHDSTPEELNQPGYEGTSYDYFMTIDGKFTIDLGITLLVLFHI